MSEREHRSAVVVCGGASRRFGDQDKVFADLAGRPLVAHVIDRVEGVVDELVVNCHPRQEERLEVVLEEWKIPLAVDDRPDEGPLPGIRRGLEVATGEYALVVACDMPFVDPDFVASLFDRVVEGDLEAAIPRQPGGRLQPLQAVYAVSPFARVIEEAIERGVDRPIEPARELEHVIVREVPEPDEGPGTFFNVNTPEDLAVAAAVLE
ncbi:MAG: molybdenum cofactor guanylyltransferase [Halodesulfurarchaeum sp.]